jgi:hypothetical protein
MYFVITFSPNRAIGSIKVLTKSLTHIFFDVPISSFGAAVGWFGEHKFRSHLGEYGLSTHIGQSSTTSFESFLMLTIGEK